MYQYRISGTNNKGDKLPLTEGFSNSDLLAFHLAIHKYRKEYPSVLCLDIQLTWPDPEYVADGSPT